MQTVVLKVIKSNYFVILLVFILGLVFRSLNLKYASLDLDDTFSIYYAHSNWEHLSEVFSFDINPPTYYITLFSWFKLVGESVFKARFLSVIFSAISGVLIWVLTSKYVGKKAGIIAISLFLLSNYQLSLSLLVRGFAMSQLFSILSFYFFLEVYHNKKKTNFIFYTISTSILLSIHQTTFLIPLIQFILLFLFRWNKKKVITIIIGQMLILISTIPQILSFNETKDTLQGQNWREAPGVKDLWSTLTTITGSSILLYGYGISLLVSIFLLIRNKNQVNRLHLVVFFWAILGFSLAFLVSQKVPFFLPKYLSFLSPSLYILVGIVLCYLLHLNKWLGILIIASVFYSSAITLNFKSSRPENWKVVVPIAKKINQKGYDVLVSPVYMYRPFTYYFDKAIFNNVDSIMPIMYNQYGIYFSNTIDTNFFDYRFPKKIALVQAQKGHVDPDEINIKVLNHFFSNHRKTNIDGIDIHLYTR
jgi:uncharacterized membrane protein